MYVSTAYNKGGNYGAKIGNWVEEDAMDKQDGRLDGRTGSSKLDTTSRCTAHFPGDSSSNWRGESANTENGYGRVGARPLDKVGPRQVQREKDLLEQAFR